MKMRATAKMPRGVVLRYQTRMMTADGDTFDEPSPRWQRFYTQHGWASEVQAEPTAPARRRGRPPKASAPQPEPEPEPETQAEPAAPTDPYEGKTVPELREMAEARGFELPSGYVPRDELVAMLSGDEQTKTDE